MDWTMVSNAKSAQKRVQTLAYLLMERYRVDADHAGRKLANKEHEHELRNRTIYELRSFLSDGDANLAYVRFKTETEVRSYLTRFLAAYDNAIIAEAQPNSSADL